MTPPENVTQMLLDWGRGDRAALDRLMAVVYEDLRRQAARCLRRERPDHTLQTTALVHEAYMRLVDQRRVEWQDRAHFFAIAARVMRQVLVDHARRRNADKRGGAEDALPLDEALAVGAEEPPVDLVALDEALGRLEALSARQARVVELRYFGGLSVEETAEVLGVSPATVKNDWAASRAWLRRQLESGDGG
jgi:RNA polymerase sigma factor (TIGR02999 family)